MIAKYAGIYSFEVENIENYELAVNDTTQTWHCHHRKETDENLSKKELIELGLYYNRPANELIFLTGSEHNSLHKNGENNPFYGKRHSDETKQKIGAASKTRTHSDESRNKISDSLKGKNKGENNPMYGKTPWNKGKTPSEATKKKISEANKGIKRTEDFKNNLSELYKGKHWKLVDGKRVWY